MAIFLGCLGTSRADLQYYGVNLAGAEFGEVPGELNGNYTYPTSGEVDYYMSKGMNTFRVPFLWERMQPTLDGSLDPANLGALDSFISYASSKGAHVILDVHDYGAYNGNPIAGVDSPITTANFGDLWGKLADHYQNNDQVIFGLMNEPPGPYDETRLGVSTQTWLGVANAAIAAIRDVGANNLILVPGNGYDGAWRWGLDGYDGKNSDIMSGVVDPANNFAYEVHQYLDIDADGIRYSGTETNVAGLAGALAGLTSFAEWLRLHDAKGFLGEFGVAPGEVQLAALDAVLSNIDANSDVWTGWTAWAGGPWWPSDYPFLLEPKGGVDKPQIAVLADHIPTPIPEPGVTGLLLLAVVAGICSWLTRRKAHNS